MTRNTTLAPPAPERSVRTTPNPPRLSAFDATAQAPTAVFEAAFRHRLRALAGEPVRSEIAPKRSRITIVVTALRSAVGVDQVLSVTQGLDAEDLSEAYYYVADRREVAGLAVDEFFADPDAERFRQLRPQLELLLPQPTTALGMVLADDPGAFDAAVRRVHGQIRELDRLVVDVEARLSIGTPGVDASELDDGRRGGLFHEPCYRPVRVGDLMPSRLASLLGERPTDGPT